MNVLPRALRIGIDGRELEGRPTGVGRYLRSLLRRFAEHERHTFIVYASSLVTLPIDSPRIEVRVLPGGHPLVWEQTTLRRAIEADRIDVLLSPAYSCPLFTTVPRVTAIHDLSFFARRDEFTLLHGLRRRMLARASARASRFILACSQFTRSEVKRHLGDSAASRTEVVLLGPDDDLPPGPSRTKARRELALAEGEAYVITVGTILRRRHVDTLIQAFAQLRVGGQKARLGIVGENRTHPPQDLARLARELECAETVRESGFVSDEDIARHYAAADVAVFLSEYEGFGLPALEAMSRGVPTIVADRGSLNEMFAQGALVVEPEKKAASEAIARVLSDTDFAAQLTARGLERAKAFSWEKAAQQTLDILDRAAS